MFDTSKAPIETMTSPIETIHVTNEIQIDKQRNDIEKVKG